jgi:hypothetical protein
LNSTAILLLLFKEPILLYIGGQQGALTINKACEINLKNKNK